MADPLARTNTASVSADTDDPVAGNKSASITVSVASAWGQRREGRERKGPGQVAGWPL
jgi:hypothetical protein